ncbi:MAG: DUF1549 and DUF1553 domain-containing protein [Verrucomicrobia bacterium]|nr:DUF1549 and DUF1553 domain-containing protein [Verrucomicrobiota bacterium]
MTPFALFNRSNRIVPFLVSSLAAVSFGAFAESTGVVLNPNVPEASEKNRSERAPDLFTPEQRAYWAFQKVRRPEPPLVSASEWVRNPIDAFVLSRLEAKRIEPSHRADKITLLRRASFDLIGFPPTPEEVDRFLSDTSDKAFERVVDRLLSSPHYGERWARHWLDLARYAESEGFKADETRPNAWRYRDYVIRSLNDDKPYDRFVKEQIAGDELWPDDPDALIATAFNRHYPDESNARNLMQRRQELLNDITDTVGAVFTGMTYACARCHDHKFDAILQKDYYRLQAFFANSAADDNIVLSSAKVHLEYKAKLAAWEEATRAIREEMSQLEEPKRRAIIKDYVDKYPEPIQEALNKTPEERSPFERQMVAKAMLYLDPASHQYIADTKTVAGGLKGDAKKRWEALNGELESFAALHPGELPIGTGIHDLSMESPQTHVLRGGVYDAPLEAVAPGFLSIVDPEPAQITPCNGNPSTGRRATLANILADPENPLTARVMANRLWHYHFGRGIAENPSDFGRQSDLPSNPELLDWLTTEFVRSGWSIKSMHRLIMSSSTYQQSSGYRTSAVQIDPGNKLLWRFPRQRLEGEVIRDSALAVAGLLNPKMGGPSVFPELPPGMSVRGGWRLNSEESERNRRSIYVFVRRNTRYPLFESFDMPDTHESCARRNRTTSPLQALNLLNSEPALKWAQGFAGRVMESTGSTTEERIDRAYQLAYSRTPSPGERKMVGEFLKNQEAIISERIADGEEVALPRGATQSVNPTYAAAMVDFCHMLMNSNEFVYRN